MCATTSDKGNIIHFMNVFTSHSLLRLIRRRWSQKRPPVVRATARAAARIYRFLNLIRLKASESKLNFLLLDPYGA